MDFTLSNEQRSWQMTARKFANEEIRPISVERDEISDPRETFDWGDHPHLALHAVAAVSLGLLVEVVVATPTTAPHVRAVIGHTVAALDAALAAGRRH